MDRNVMTVMASAAASSSTIQPTARPPIGPKHPGAADVNG